MTELPKTLSEGLKSTGMQVKYRNRYAYRLMSGEWVVIDDKAVGLIYSGNDESMAVKALLEQ